MQNIDIKGEENGMIQLWKLYTESDKYNPTISNLETKIGNSYRCLIWKWWKKCEEESLENILVIYKLDNEIVETINKIFANIVDFEYFKEEIDEDFTSLKWLTAISRISLFTVIDKLENGNENENEAIEILLTYSRLWDKLLKWDTSFVWMIVWLSISWYVNSNINYVIDNYHLTEEHLNILKNELTNIYNSEDILSNVAKVEYWSNKYSLEGWIEKGYIKSSMIFNKEDYFNEMRNMWSDFFTLEKKVDNNDYFKRNYLYHFIWWPHNLNWINYKKDIDDLNIKRKELLEKIELKLGE